MVKPCVLLPLVMLFGQGRSMSLALFYKIIT
jgi:hypothetical protein